MPFYSRSLTRPHSRPRQQVKLEAALAPARAEPESLSSVPKEELRDGNEGRWEDAQNLKFAVFMAYYQDIFASRHKRKHSKIFKTLADYLSDRTPAQCRSHFQKLLVKHKTAAKIKKHFRESFGERRFDQDYECFRQEWERSHKPVRRATLAVREFREISTQTEELALKEEAFFQGYKSALLVDPLVWGMVKAEECSNAGYYLPLQ